MRNPDEIVSLEEALEFDISIGEHLTYTVDDRLAWEHSMDDVVPVECVPSSIPVHFRYARRLERKFGVSQKDAILAAYMLYQIADLREEVCNWFEQTCEEVGFEPASKQVRKIFFELHQCDARSTDVMGKCYESLPQGEEFYTIPLVPEDAKRRWVEPPENPIDVSTRRIISKIRRAGIHQIGEMGKKLYEWSKDQRTRELYGFERIQAIWEAYKDSQKRLEKYKKKRG